MSFFFFFFTQQTAYDIYQCDWSSDVCSSDLVDSVSRAGAEQAVIELRSRLDNTIFLGQWSRWAWQRVDGVVEVLPVEGFQVIVVADSEDCGPVAPPIVNGVPVTEVRGPLEDFIAGLVAADQQLETGLGFTVDLPVSWTADSTATADEWSESVVGDGGGFFRVRAMDRPDRSLFVDLADPDLPDLGEAAAEMAGLFPPEFGTTPEIVSTTVDARAAYVIIPSADATTPETVTYLFYSPLSSWRFLEVAIDRAHDAVVMDTFTWLPDPLGTEPTGPAVPFALQTAEDLVVAVSATGIEASSLEDPFLPIGGIVAGRQRRICVAGGLVRVLDRKSVV